VPPGVWREVRVSPHARRLTLDAPATVTGERDADATQASNAEGSEAETR
jgi:hypothetical protein